MNIEYIEDILTRLKFITSYDYEDAEKLKVKAHEAMKSIFPTEFSIHGNIDRLQFKPSYYPTTQEGLRKHFEETRNKLIAIIEAKIDVLKHKAKQAPKTLENTSLISTMAKHVKEENTSLKQQIKILSETNDILEELKDELNNQISEAESSLIDKDNLIKSSRKLRIFKDIGLGTIFLSGAFALGALTVTMKIDYDKRKLQETVDSQAVEIKKLKQTNSKTKLLLQTKIPIKKITN